jgi:site-specific recombinase XerC
VCAFWRRRARLATDPTAGLGRPKVPLDRTRALTREQIATLWRRDDVAVRERTLWRLLYKTVARANEILSLDIEDLDLPNKRARVRSKGGATD